VSWPKAAVRLPPPWGEPGKSYTVTVIGYDFRAVAGVDSKVRITDGNTTKLLEDVPAFEDIPEGFEIVEEAVLWVKLRRPWPECERRFEIPARDVLWVNTEAAHAYRIGTTLHVIGIGFGADQKMDHYRKEMGLCKSEDGT
jgi:hypothetical protein